MAPRVAVAAVVVVVVVLKFNLSHFSARHVRKICLVMFVVIFMLVVLL